MQRRPAVDVFGPQIGASLRENLDHGNDALAGGHVQRCPLIVIAQLAPGAAWDRRLGLGSRLLFKAGIGPPSPA